MAVGRLSRARRHHNPPLPLPAGPVSNGEFVPAAPTPGHRATDDLVRSAVDAAATRLGMDRRRFLQSAGAVAASLAAFELGGCTGAPSGRSSKAPGTGPGGTFRTPPPVDADACHETLATAGEFIFDVHTHHVIPAGPWVQNAPSTVGLVLGMLPAGCSDLPQLDCVDRATYLHDMFLASDTTVAVLTDVPNSGPSNAPVPFPDAVDT